MKVVLISGKAQHGKDTIGEMVANELRDMGKRVLVTHYSDLVKYICKTFFDWNGEKDEKGRTLLQYVGTDVVREKNPNYWVGFIVSILEMFGDNWDYVVIPDTRFPNEVELVKLKFEDAVHIRVIRPGFESSLTDEQKEHPSETALDEYIPDYYFENVGTLEEVRDSVKFFLEDLM